jgi:hypothetical protein
MCWVRAGVAGTNTAGTGTGTNTARPFANSNHHIPIPSDLHTTNVVDSTNNDVVDSTNNYSIGSLVS